MNLDTPLLKQPQTYRTGYYYLSGLPRTLFTISRISSRLRLFETIFAVVNTTNEETTLPDYEMSVNFEEVVQYYSMMPRHVKPMIV